MNAPHRRKEWLEFKDWCGQRKLKAFPAHPWTLSAYIVWLEAHRRYRTLHKRMDVIARVHIRACVHSPDQEDLVKRTLEAIEARRAAGPHKSFTGKDLLEPKKRKLKLAEKAEKKKLSHLPRLVSKRPQPEI
ncbi:hypothetical protein MTBPR1_130034 [Candidatus Terasakiella magnetica]|uniref:Uncharacterized protein n=1 Tax=Candidatus Terasakiella magnetica TaxID=1867952 RepID=A0A1C3RF04_9PROT|nr:hypothetical protein [Candidatus Terasakiella magnetica]SCA55838.1 hypothetical protein MTBPR1_130034 [Candidatus Terasakiella magnetica]